MSFCFYCNEPLRFEVGRGWVHFDGSKMKEILRYPYRCKLCTGKLPKNGYCYKCDKQWSQQLLYDHMALPSEEIRPEELAL